MSRKACCPAPTVSASSRRAPEPIQLGGSTYALTTAIDITEQRRIEQEFFSRAYLDELTGLPNRSLLQQSTEDLIGPS